MATWLNEYKELKGGIAQQANGGQMALEQLMLHQELLYRIEVLEACQTLCKTAPITTDLQAMSGHYKPTFAAWLRNAVLASRRMTI